MTEIFYTKCSDLYEYSDKIESFLSLNEKTRLNKISNRKLRLCSAVSRFLILYMAKLNLDTDFIYDKNGKPSLDGIYISISHTDDIVAVALSDCEIGIDCEKSRENTDKIAERFFDESEKEYLRNNPNGFTRVWTLKEAVSKLFGTGLSMDYSSFCVYPFDTEHLIRGKYVSFFCSKIYGLPFSSASFNPENEYSVKEINFIEVLKELDK